MERIIGEAKRLRALLHDMPEPSGGEYRTKAALLAYLRRSAGLELVDCGGWFYAAHREPDAAESLALRAELDAVTLDDGSVFHGCGHDGHMSVMAALAAAAGDRRLGRNLFFLFQHAEETGAGAADCCALFERERIDAVFGFHNCPGFPAGSVLLRQGSFACASRGLLLRFTGRRSHAAYPENGNNPIFPMAAFFEAWAELTDPARYRGMVLMTPVYLASGACAFGVAPGGGALGLTLRAWYDTDLDLLDAAVRERAGGLAAESGLGLEIEVRDPFPATVNDPALHARVSRAAAAAGLPCLTPPEPFRWSEDFGHYGAHTRAFFCGGGAGETAADLHTPGYEWNDAVTAAAVRLFGSLIGLSVTGNKQIEKENKS